MNNIILLAEKKELNFFQQNINSKKYYIQNHFSDFEEFSSFIDSEYNDENIYLINFKLLKSNTNFTKKAQYLKIIVYGELNEQKAGNLAFPFLYYFEKLNKVNLNLAFNISEKYLKNEKELKHLNKYKNLSNKLINSSNNLLIITEKGIIKELNNRALKTFHLENKNNTPPLFYSLLPDFQPQGIHSVVYFEQNLSKLENQEIINFELSILINNSLKRYNTEISKINQKEEIYLISFSDIEINKNNNNVSSKIKHFFNRINISILLINADNFSIEDANLNALLFFKLPIDTLKRKQIKDLFGKEMFDYIIKQNKNLSYLNLKIENQVIPILFTQTKVNENHRSFIILSFIEDIKKNIEKKVEYKKDKNTLRILEQQHKEFNDSLKYAHRIQTTLLPSDDYIAKYFNSYFIYFQPKDIVSGDFYWANFHNGNFYFAVGDSTGHGVPGAFMSILGMSFLNEIVNDLEKGKAALILEMLRNKIIKTLKQKSNFGEIQDGFDMSFLIINFEKLRLQFAGANMSFFILRKGKVVEIKGDRIPIGIHINSEKPFTNHVLRLEKEDKIYLYSDGIVDQFGGDRNKKLTLQKLIKNILLHADKSMEEQNKLWNDFIKRWMKDEEQTDDMILIGIEI